MHFLKKIQKNSLEVDVHADYTGSGFTLIELIVVIAIIGIVLTIVIPSFKSYDSNVLVTNAAYDMALTLRQTQFYGIAVQETGVNSGNFSYAYGIHFSSASRSYLLYQDIPTYSGTTPTYNYTYNAGASPTEALSTASVSSNYTILKICVVSNGAESCQPADNTNTAYVDVEFVRPNPEAYVTSNVTGSTPVTHKPSDVDSQYGARICITSGVKTKSVYVDKTGQISVGDGCP